MGEPQTYGKPPINSPPFTTSSSESEKEELQRLEHAPPFWRNRKKLSKQLSMCETTRDTAWERRRRQILRQERKKQGINDSEVLTDDDLSELKGCIELGFGFNEENGQRLCNTLPALDLYFAVNRQFATSPLQSPNGGGSSTSIGISSTPAGDSSRSLGSRSSSFDSPRSDDSWKICSPG
ncbi:hypothetical protein LOK49_LG03G01976 [Camellia lanceoleosa]|uniref:Uncharacterized protein n=1 Tax=Camellia lanceoleosa TaxID=1840588 RepID=A0ACC0ICI4_9ERIC|nr:hypothetical protein LOK49_LG03G01976 [Camellia lanceoleosa]